MNRYICIHGHFYQPPRENPGLDEVERQESAAPYHDWNERITRECYAPNAAARILDAENQIVKIANNYARISFNFGPTLLSWMERHEPIVYEQILAADRESRELFSGHGAALAQVYNHAILPLCNERDRRTQVAWGLRDFERRFGRPAEGMWLAETAVDTASLEELAAQGVRFTILAPRQAMRTRIEGRGAWSPTAERGVDPRRPYRAHLPSGRSIVLFFYDGPISQAIAFERLLASGETFARRLMGGFVDRAESQLVHVATDGETYGHHHRFGEMALAHAIDLIDARDDVALTIYGEYLDLCPPVDEVEIHEESSWSCAHGIERWRSNCGCNGGGGPGWTQEWRGPLRDALDVVRDDVATKFEDELVDVVKDPWAARDDYVDVILDRRPAIVDAFLARHRRRELTAVERVRVLTLFEQQRHAMNMYTSCGWFFDDIAGIEGVQILAYADRVLQIDEERYGSELSERFLDDLAKAPGNRPRYPDGRQTYVRLVRPSRIDLARVAAQALTRSVFDREDVASQVHSYDVDHVGEVREEANGWSLIASRVRVRFRLTGEEALFSGIAVHFGGPSISIGLTLDDDDGVTHERVLDVVREPFLAGDFLQVTQRLEEGFGGRVESLKSLFRDDQRRILYFLLRDREEEVEAVFRRLYLEFRPLAHLLAELEVPLPDAFTPAARFAIHDALREALSQPIPDVDLVAELVGEAERHGIELLEEELAHTLRSTIEGEAERFSKATESLDALERLVKLANLAKGLPFVVDLWRVQNICWDLNQSELAAMRSRAEGGVVEAREWVDLFVTWSRRLGVRPS